MILLRLISWFYFRKRLARALPTTAGVILGVAPLVAVRTANQSVLSSIDETVDRIAGKAQLQALSGDAGFPEEVLEGVRIAPGSARRCARDRSIGPRQAVFAHGGAGI